MVRCWNDVMNNVEYVVKRDVYPPKIHLCSKKIRGISKKYIKCYCMVFLLVER